MITNAAQQAVWRYDNTEPFNDSPANEDPSGLGVFEFNLGFPGQRRDRETGLWYNDQRDGYDATRGQYTQAEPMGLLGDINLYRYARSNPLTVIDPDGRNPVGGAAVGGMIAGPPGAIVGGVVGLAIGIGIGGMMSQSSSEAERLRCEADCDRDYDTDQKWCEAKWKMTGRQASAYRECMEKVREKYIKCYQDCAKKCK